MKKESFLWALLLILAVCAISSCSKDDTEINQLVGHGVTNGHEWVNLGFPSGTLWATCNVGASKPEEYGDYFAWGETKTKDDYCWNTYLFFTKDRGDIMVTKYYTASRYYDIVGDNKTELEAIDDAATVNWGSDWQVPSHEQVIELYSNSTTIWTMQNGVNGRKVTSNINGNHIFLPAAGRCQSLGTRGAGDLAYYWSRTLSEDSQYSFVLRFDSDYFYEKVPVPPQETPLGGLLPNIGTTPTNNYERFYGFPIRPVRKY